MEDGPDRVDVGVLAEPLKDDLGDAARHRRQRNGAANLGAVLVHDRLRDRERAQLQQRLRLRRLRLLRRRGRHDGSTAAAFDVRRRRRLHGRDSRESWSVSVEDEVEDEVENEEDGARGGRHGAYGICHIILP